MMSDVAPKQKVLVTGGAGYIGSILTEKLLTQGYDVVVFDDLSYTDIGIRHLYDNPRLLLIKGDIRDPNTVNIAVKNIDSVIHLAAIANDPSGEVDPSLTRSINLDSYYYLLQSAKEAGVARFINASTAAVYGIKDEPNVTEDMPLKPLREYSECKAKSEELVRDFNEPGFTTVSLRCATVCGWSPRMRFDLIVNTLTFHAILYGKITLWGGEQHRPQIHILDLTNYFISLLEIPKDQINGEIFNAGGENVSIQDIAESIRSAIGPEIVIEQTPARDDERSYHVSSEKIAQRLGLRPTRTIADAVSDIVTTHQNGLWDDPHDPIYHNIKRVKQLLENKRSTK